MKGSRLYPLFMILALIGLCWMLIPFFLGFSPSQEARWGSLSDAPEILSEWRSAKNHTGEITITEENGKRTVITTRNGEIVSVETFGG